MPTYEYKCDKCGTMEIFHGIKSDPEKICPECGKEGLERLISSGGAVIIKGKQACQYNDIKAAKYWRDADGNKWPVGPGDGSSKSPTPSRKRKRSKEQVDTFIKKEQAVEKKKRTEQSYNRFVNRVKKTK